jgi:hypothetical protein
MVSPDIEDRGEVEVSNWAKHKKTYSKQYILFYLQADHKIYFLLLQLQ